MQQLIHRQLGGATACVSHSTRDDGDLSPSTVAAPELERRRRAAVPHRWCAVRQVHSDRVITVHDAAALSDRPVADALVTAVPGIALAVHSGDCVPVGFVSDAGAVAAAHAGWKGLEAGVLESTVRQLRSLGGDAPIAAAVGPHIHPEHYEFGRADLARLRARFDDSVVGATSDGRPALDLSAAIARELERLDVGVEHWSSDCTASDADQYWSHRARKEPGRIALVAWIE